MLDVYVMHLGDSLNTIVILASHGRAEYYTERLS
jgi:hypothetical protein